MAVSGKVSLNAFEEEESQQETSPLQNKMKLRPKQSAHETRESGRTNTPERAKWLAIGYQCQYCFKICRSLYGLTQHKNRKHQTNSGESLPSVIEHRGVPDRSELLYTKQSSNQMSDIKPHSVQSENGDTLTSEDTGTVSEVFETGTVVGIETGSVQTEETSTPQQVGTRKLQCQYCYRICKNTAGLILHERSHFVHNCKFCDQVFCNPSNLQEHVAEHHPDQTNHAFKCVYCSKSFPTDTAVKQHVESSHDLDKPYMCEWCGRTFRNKAYLPEHFRIHQQIPHECELCGKVFTLPRYLKKHIDRSHKQ